jgi:hypothetical protein
VNQISANTQNFLDLTLPYRMKNIILLSFAIAMFACGKKAPETATQVVPETALAELNPQAYKFYGDSISLKDAITVDSLEKRVKATNGEIEALVVGEVQSSCQTMGCWVKVKMGDNSTENIQVMTKDHAFFLPLADFKGKKIVFKGIAFYDTTSVENLKEFAADEKLPAEEIAKIKEPKLELSFIAEGIAIQKQDNDINKVQ